MSLWARVLSEVIWGSSAFSLRGPRGFLGGVVVFGFFHVFVDVNSHLSDGCTVIDIGLKHRCVVGRWLVGCRWLVSYSVRAGQVQQTLLWSVLTFSTSSFTVIVIGFKKRRLALGRFLIGCSGSAGLV